MQKYAIILLSLALISSVAYALSSSETLSERVERENRETLIRCLDEASTKPTTQEVLRAKNTCSESILTKVIVPISHSGTLATGSTVVPPSIIDYWETEQSENDYLHKLHDSVCKVQIHSPLCKDYKLFSDLYVITEKRIPKKNFFPILLGITNAESSLGLNFAKDNVGGTCAGRNNWGGVKWQITDSGERIKDQKIPDQYGCYLYKFDSIEHYWISKVNTVRFGYKGCVDHKTPIRCMSYAYVGNRYVAEESWIRNVSIFLD